MSPLRTRHRAPSSPGDPRPCAGMRQVHPHAAGGDSGAQALVAGGPDGADPPLGRTVGPSTAALQTRAHGCVDRGLHTGAMAATGGSWLPRCEALAARGLQGCRSRAPSMHRLPGRQRAVLDGQGRPTWHRSG